MRFALFGCACGLLDDDDSKTSLSPSFPHVSSENPGETRPGPPIKTFGGDNSGEIIIEFFDRLQLTARPFFLAFRSSGDLERIEMVLLLRSASRASQRAAAIRREL